MKFAFMSFSTPTLRLDETLALAHEIGYDAIEPRAGSGHGHGIELTTTTTERTAIRSQIAESPINVCCLAISCRYADPDTVADQIDETRRYIDLAGELGIARLRVFGGKIPQGISREAAIDGVAGALRTVADHAAAAGVTICLETHDDWCTPAHVAAVMQRVDSPGVAVNWDIMHPVRAGGATMQEAFDTLQPWIQHVHVHDGSTRLDALQFAPIGQGDIDHGAALRLLHESGYTGYLSGEWINWEPYAVHLPRELATLHAILRQVV